MDESRSVGTGLTLVVPCYNEANRLDLPSFRDFLNSHGRVKILFVDDGSRDDTRGVLEQLREEMPDHVAVLGDGHNRGKAEAVRLGVAAALKSNPPFVGFWDADLATPLSAVCDFLDIFEEHPEVLMVFGARVKLLGRHVERRAIRHYLGRVFATVASSVLRLDIYDTQCGAKLFRVDDSLRTVFADHFLSKWVFDVEILARYSKLFDYDHHRLERAIYEYPLQQWVDIAGSKIQAKDFLTAFLDIVRIKRKYL